MSRPHPACPFCGSGRTLPFEREEDYRREYTPEVAVYAGITLVSLFIGLLLVTALLFRVLLLVATLIALYLYKNRRRSRPGGHGSFVCLDCSRFFKN